MQFGIRLQELKEMDYNDYLQTPEWQDTRKSALRRSGYACQLCSSNGELHVHHKTYERLGYEHQNDLIVLCADCHAKFHNKVVDNGQEHDTSR
jgi:5-methylcytosine-specific restriction endonuclease McrA